MPVDFAAAEVWFTVIARDVNSGQTASRPLTVQVGMAAGPPSPVKALPLSGLESYAPPLPITRSPVTNSQEVKLTDAISEVVVGAGGRFLLLRCQYKPLIHVFDVMQARIAKSITVPISAPMIAAGGSHFYFIHANGAIVDRWRFSDLTQVDSRSLPAELRSAAWTRAFATMGDESPGPLYLCVADAGKSYQIDPMTLSFGELPWPRAAIANASYLSASSDGQFVCALSSVARERPAMAFVRNGVATVYRNSDMEVNIGRTRADYLVPSADGKIVFGSNQAWAGDRVLAHALTEFSFWTPARESGFYVVALRANRGASKLKSGGVRTFFVGRISDSMQRTGELEIGIGGGGNISLNDQPDLDRSPPFCQRVHYYPTAGFIAALSSDCKKMILQKADPGAIFGAARGSGFVFPLCKPPRFVKAGQEVTMPFGARSSFGNVSVHLQEAPAGMTIAKDKLIWKTPTVTSPTEVHFTLEVQGGPTAINPTQRYATTVLPSRTNE